MHINVPLNAESKNSSHFNMVDDCAHLTVNLHDLVELREPSEIIEEGGVSMIRELEEYLLPGDGKERMLKNLGAPSDVPVAIYNKIYDKKSAVKYLGISPKELREFMDNGKVRFYRPKGGKYQFCHQDLEDLYKNYILPMSSSKRWINSTKKVVKTKPLFDNGFTLPKPNISK